MKREELLRNVTFWTETIQYKIYNDIVEFIEQNSLSNKELSKKLGVSKGRVSQILNGDNLNFRIDTLVKICLAIGKVPNFKFTEIDDFISEDTYSNVDIIYHTDSNKKIISTKNYIELNLSSKTNKSSSKGRLIKFSDIHESIGEYENAVS